MEKILKMKKLFVLLNFTYFLSKHFFSMNIHLTEMGSRDIDLIGIAQANLREITITEN